MIWIHYCLNLETVAVELRLVICFPGIYSFFICFSLIHKQEQCQPHILMCNIFLSTL